MKKTFYTFLFLITCITSSYAQKTTLNFGYPEINQNNGYIELTYSDLNYTAKPGYPVIPFAQYNVLEKQNSVSKEVIISNIEYYENQISGKIIPALKPEPISKPNKEFNFVENADIYSSIQYPENVASALKTHFLRGHGITSIIIYPVEYYPAENKIKFIKSITLENVSIAKKSETSAYDDPQTIEKIKAITNDYQALSTYSYSNVKNEDVTDLLLITSEEFAQYFDEYIQFKRTMGYYCSIETVEDIMTNYEGDDKQMKIRNCIKDYYNNRGLKYVILGGDADTGNEAENIIPCRGFHALDDPCIPSDIYYSNLDGTWDDNHNNIWGEIGEDDLYAEVAIGRICVDNSEEIAHSTNKLMRYQSAPVVNDIEKALMVGESLDDQTFGGNYKDEIAAGTSNHGFSTYGIPQNITVSRLYERDQNWSGADVKKFYSKNGVHLVNHLGHSNVDYNMKMNVSAITTTGFTNDGINHSYAIQYSQGCYNGSFDNRSTVVGNYGSADCFAEVFSNLETGNVATIANSRYGWYMPGNTNSSSQFYDRLFYDGFLNKGYYKIGEANSFSKEAYVSWLEDEYFRWTAFELNLFGDPSMEIWTEKPTACAINMPNIILKSSPTLNVNTNAPNGRIAIMLDNNLIARFNLDENGAAVIDLSNCNLNVGDALEVICTGHNKEWGKTHIIVKDNAPVLSATCVFNNFLGNDDGIINHSEQMTLGLTITNEGNTAVENQEFTISCNQNFITLNTESFTIEALQSGESCFVSELIATINNEAQNSVAVFTITGADNTCVVFTDVLVPVLSLQSYEFTEVNGNNNGIIETGEIGQLSLTYYNSGRYHAKENIVSITAPNIYTSIPLNEITIETIEPNESKTITFNFVVSEDCPVEFGSYFNTNLLEVGNLNVSQELLCYYGKSPIVFVDLDKNTNSLTTVAATLKKMVGIEVPYYTEMPAFDEISKYSLAFVSLGVMFYNYKISEEEANVLKSYLDSGNKGLYLESGSLWYYDKNYGINEYFSLEGGAGEENWMHGFTNIVGVDGEFTEGMSFGYEGDNKRIDYQLPISPAVQIFNNAPVTFGGATAYIADNYRTIGSSFELGGLTETENSSVDDLLNKYLEFFDMIFYKPAKIAFGNDTTACRYSILKLNAGDGFVDYDWSTGDSGESIEINLETIENSSIAITLNAVDEKGYMVSKTITINIENCVGITNYENDILIYPNPTDNTLYISTSHENILTQIYDISGRSVINATKSHNIDVSKLNTGIYFVEINVEGNIITNKIIKN